MRIAKLHILAAAVIEEALEALKQIRIPGSQNGLRAVFKINGIVTVTAVPENAGISDVNGIKLAVSVRGNSVAVGLVLRLGHIHIWVEAKALDLASVFEAKRVGAGVVMHGVVLPIPTVVKHRRLVPVAVESQVRQAQRGRGIAFAVRLRLKHNEPFNKHAGFVMLVKISHSILVKRDGEAYVNAAARGHGNRLRRVIRRIRT